LSPWLGRERPCPIVELLDGDLGLLVFIAFIVTTIIIVPLLVIVVMLIHVRLNMLMIILLYQSPLVVPLLLPLTLMPLVAG